MIRKLLTLIILISFTSLFAQDFDRYDLESRTEVYTPLTNATVALGGDSDWADFYSGFQAESEFAFEIFGETHNGIFNFLSQNILVGSGFDYYNYDYEALLSIFIPYGPQFENRAQIAGNDPSLIRFETVGEPGSRIFKVEYANTGFFIEQDELGTSDMFANMQVWIYEGSTCIEYHYGPTNITDEELILDGEPGFVAGIIATTIEGFGYGDAEYIILANGDASNPTEFEINLGDDYDDDTEGFTTSIPTEGMVYSFCPEGSSVSTKNAIIELDWNLYPNPVESTLTLDFNNLDQGQYTLHSMDGKLITEGPVVAGQTTINVNNLAAGHYITKVTTEEGISVKRFFKANTSR